MFEVIFLQFLNGLDKGAAYALIALGLTLVFGTLGVVNFAHGALFMLGAFCAVLFRQLLTLETVTIDPTKLSPWGAPLEVRTRVWYNPDMVSVVFMVPALIGIILQMQATLLTSSAIVRERERGTIEQLIVTPIRSLELIVGKILPYALIAMLILIMVLMVGVFWFGVPVRGSVLLLLGISSLFLLSSLGIGLLISTVAQTQQEAFLLSFLTLLPSIFLSGFIYPLAALPKVLQVLSGIIPLSYFLIVVRGIVIKGVGVPALVPQITALAIFGGVLIVLAATRFRKRLD